MTFDNFGESEGDIVPYGIVLWFLGPVFVRSVPDGLGDRAPPSNEVGADGIDGRALERPRVFGERERGGRLSSGSDCR